MPRAALLLALLVLPACSDDPGDTTTTATDTGGTDTSGTDTGGTTGSPTTSASTDDTTSDTTGDTTGSEVWETPYCRPVKDGPAWPAPFPGWEEQVLMLVNEARAKGHDCDSKGNFGPTSPLTMNASLRCAARKHAADMATRDFFDHVNPSGETFVDRILKAGYGSYAEIGENIAAGLDIDDPQVAVDGWLASDGHCANIMNPLYTEFGAGAYEGGGTLTFYWTQEFGRPN